jgi:hypothetical protein
MVRLTPFGAGARRAIVVGSDVVYGMARMYQILRDTAPDHLEVFRDLASNVAWLGLTEAATDVQVLLAAIRPA